MARQGGIFVGLLIFAICNRFVAATPKCLELAKTSDAIIGLTIDSCVRFYTSGRAIRLDDDTADAKFGMIITNAPFQAMFQDRSGTKVKFDTSLLPAVTSSQVYSQLIVKAFFSSTGRLRRIAPVLFVLVEAMLKPFRNFNFVGDLASVGQPASVPASAFFRWDFDPAVLEYVSPKLTITGLPGLATNMFLGVRDAGGSCRSALCSNSAPTPDACNWYRTYTAGPSQNNSIRLTWNSSAVADGPANAFSLFVVDFPVTRNSYAAPAPFVSAMLAGSFDSTKQFVFAKRVTLLGGGDPASGVVSYSGFFAPKSPPGYCRVLVNT